MVIPFLQTVLFLIFYVVIFGLCVWAVIDLLRRPSSAFPAADKRTKQFWGIVLGVATAIAFMALPPPLGLNFLPFLALLSAVAAVVYLVDVRPALVPYTRRRGPRGPSSPDRW